MTSQEIHTLDVKFFRNSYQKKKQMAEKFPKNNSRNSGRKTLALPNAMLIQKCFHSFVQPSVKQKKMLFVVKNYGRSGVVSHKMHVFQKAKESVCNLCTN